MGMLQADTPETIAHIMTQKFVMYSPLFANVPKGAEASAINYSVIETAKKNGLDPYRYLAWLMHEAPKLDMGTEDKVVRLMPGNAT